MNVATSEPSNWFLYFRFWEWVWGFICV